MEFGKNWVYYFVQNITEFQDMCNMTKKSPKNENDKILFILKINKNYARYIP